MLRKLGLVTAWHITDIDNLESISKNGLLSRADIEKRQLPFRQVGWESIVESRPVGKENVLSFVTPYNGFAYGRHENHLRYHPNSRGLCLLEIDLDTAIGWRMTKTLISSGNIAKTRIPARIENIAKFEEVLIWNAFLNPQPDSSEVTQNALMSEILLPAPVPIRAIRCIWVENQTIAGLIKQKLPSAPIRLCDGLFQPGFKLGGAAFENFAERLTYPPYRVRHPKLGEGKVIGSLGRGQRAIAVFDGKHHVISFGSYRHI
jgi:hypothetical protein